MGILYTLRGMEVEVEAVLVSIMGTTANDIMLSAISFLDLFKHTMGLLVIVRRSLSIHKEFRMEIQKPYPMMTKTFISKPSPIFFSIDSSSTFFNFLLPNFNFVQKLRNCANIKLQPIE